MKFHEYNNKSVTISPGLQFKTIAMAATFSIALFTLSWVTGYHTLKFTSDWPSMVATRVEVVAAICFLVLPFMRTVTIFEMVSNVILIRNKLAGITIRTTGMPLDNAKLIGVIPSGHYGGTNSYSRYVLYIESNRGKKYWIGNFSTAKHYDEFLEKLLHFVPVKYIKNF